MRNHRLAAACLAALSLTGAISACGSSDDSSSTSSAGGSAASATTSSAKSGKGVTIAFLMPCSTCADRFEQQDKPDFEAAVQKLAPGAKVIANNAEGDSGRQVTQTESAITNGADVIVVSPLDESAGAAISDKAAQAHVPVVLYDGLITGAKADYYVRSTTRRSASFRASSWPRSSRPATVAFINGDQSIAPGRQFKAGAHKALDPLIESGKLKKGYEGDAQQFNPQKGRTMMEQALTKLNDKIDAVIAANDGLAGGVATRSHRAASAARCSSPARTRRTPGCSASCSESRP